MKRKVFFFFFSNTTRGPLGICYKTWWDENGVKPKSGLWVLQRVDDERTVKWNESRLEFQISVIIGYISAHACRLPEALILQKRMGKTRPRLTSGWDVHRTQGTTKIKKEGLDGIKFVRVCQEHLPVFTDATGWRLMDRAAGQDCISTEQN